MVSIFLKYVMIFEMREDGVKISFRVIEDVDKKNDEMNIVSS